MNGKQAQPAVADAPTAAVRAARYRGEPRSPNGPSGVHIRSVATEGPNERCCRGRPETEYFLDAATGLCSRVVVALRGVHKGV